MNINDLQAHIGSELGTSDWFMVDQSRIDAFANVTCDHQYIHVDPARAKAETPFGGTIAHGHLTLSLVPHLCEQVLPGIEGFKSQINYGLNRVRFLNPVGSGSRVRATLTPRRVSERRDGQFLVAYDVRVEIDGSDTPALIAQTLALYL